jgi:hypothetical protein
LFERAATPSGRLFGLVGQLRCPRKKRQKALAWATWAALCCSLGGTGVAAAAPTAHVENRCGRLSAADYEELDARIQLLLHSQLPARPPPAIVCDLETAWLEWEGRRYRILGQAPLVEEAVDIVESQLHDAERRPEAYTQAQEDAAVAAGEPFLKSEPARRTRKRWLPEGGGVTVGIESELPSDSIGLSMGPVFDFGGSVGPLLLGGREAFRFGLGERNVLFMDFEGAVAYGAPFDPDHTFGGVLRLGAEWLISYPDDVTAQATVAPILSLGLRAAKNLGFASPWVGIDARVRLQRLQLSDVAASDVSGSLTLGVRFIDWSGK